MLEDTIPPVFDASTPLRIVVSQGESAAIPAASATDNADGALTIAAAGAVSTATLGTHNLTYTATDAAGNTATWDLRVYVVGASAARIVLAGDSAPLISVGATFTDPGAEITNGQGIGLAGLSPSVEGAVDTATAGDYTLVYRFRDEGTGDELAVPMLRLVRVRDMAAPVRCSSRAPAR